MTRIFPVPAAPVAMMLGASPTHRRALSNATAQSALPMATARSPAVPTAAPASEITFDTSFYELAFGRARFSTRMGQSPRRSIPRSTDDRPCPIIRSDIERDVREKVAALEKQYPDFVRDINEPRGYRDLYEYFDGYDLWVEGVVYCWQVIAAIGNKNAFLNKLADKEINEYAIQWVLFHEDRVICHPNMRDLTELFNVDELADLDGLRPGQLSTLKAKLLVYRDKLLRDYRKKEGPTWEMRPVKLYPVQEGGAVSVIQPHDPQSVGGGGIMPPVPLLPISHMNNYGRFQGQRPTGNWPNRPRGVSDASRLRGNSRAGDIGRRTLSSKGSPSRDEPIYVYNGGSERPPQFTTSSGTLGRVSGDVRVSGLEGLEAPQLSEPEIVYPFEKEGSNGALTFQYAPKCIDDNNSYTVYVAPVARELYASHGLQRLMSQCGEVENVHYPFAEGNHGPAFVKFTNAESAELAIRQFDQFQLPTTGVIISVSRPRPRIRSNSNAMQKSSFRTPRDFQEFNPNGPRRQTLRQRTYSNNGPNFSTSKSSTTGETSIAMGIQSQAFEMVQHQAAMDRLPFRSMQMDGLPLGPMENRPLPPKPQTRSNIQDMSKKENSPMKPTPFNTPTKESEGQKPARGAKSKKGRGNKQNSSTRPTPASTPVRSMSIAQLSDMIENAPPQMGQLTQAKPPLKIETGSLENKQQEQEAQASVALDESSGPPQNSKPKKKKKKNSAAKSLSTSPSFLTNASESLLSPTEAVASDSFTSKSSPTEAGTSDSFTSQSANTSRTNLSSRKQSLASGVSDKSLTLEMSVPATADGPESKQRALGGKGRKPSNQNHSKKESNPRNQTEAKEISEPIQQNKSAQQPQPKKGTHENALGKQIEQGNDAKKEQKDQQKESKKENTAKNRSKDAEQLKNKKDNNGQNQAKAEQQAQPQKGTQVKPDTKENEPPKTSKKDDTGSQRKADAKNASTKKSSDAGPASQNVPAKVAQSPPKQVLADPTEWPALSPMNSPQSMIADGKRPPPLSAPTIRLPVHPKPIVPAVPAMPRKPRPQP